MRKFDFMMFLERRIAISDYGSFLQRLKIESCFPSLLRQRSKILKTQFGFSNPMVKNFKNTIIVFCNSNLNTLSFRSVCFADFKERFLRLNLDEKSIGSDTTC